MKGKMAASPPRHSRIANMGGALRVPRHVLSACPDMDEMILPRFFEMYANEVCGKAYYDTAQACMKAMIIPPAQEQSEILQTIDRLHSVTDISRVEGVVMQLLIQHDKETLDSLIAAMIMLNESMLSVRHIIMEAFSVVE